MDIFYNIRNMADDYNLKILKIVSNKETKNYYGNYNKYLLTIKKYKNSYKFGNEDFTIENDYKISIHNKINIGMRRSRIMFLSKNKYDKYYFNEFNPIKILGSTTIIADNYINCIMNIELKLLYIKRLIMYNINANKYLNYVKNNNTIQQVCFYGTRNIDNKIFNFINLKELCFDNVNLYFIPKEILLLKFLEYIRFSHCKLTEIPTYIYELKNLKSINMDNNNVNYIDDKIVNLTNLEDLYLNFNKLKKLPLVITTMENLGLIDIVGNKYFDRKNLAYIRSSMPNCNVEY